MFKNLVSKIKGFFVNPFLSVEEQLLTDAEIRRIVRDAFVEFGFEDNISFAAKFDAYEDQKNLENNKEVKND